MTGLELLTGKKVMEKAAETTEGLIKGLFGSAFHETGEMIADQVRLRRFKNQIKIFEKAKAFLSEKTDFQKINLKVLAPLIEFSSYEEDENLQEMWAKLIKNILCKPFPIVLQQNAISVLNKISNDEARILNYVYNVVEQKRVNRAKSDNRMPRLDLFLNSENGNNNKKNSKDYKIDWFSISLKSISSDLKIDQENLETLISNLVALGTLKYKTEVEVTNAEKSSEDPDDKELDIELDVRDYNYIKITKLGFVFVELCEK
ncbi:DUF4393 domain-containing protein [Chryseobacterium sp. PS-8]|uniref:DUF4393 domain-containing protein n=1 Tax=Chryseobacterium indicum TaxID=2766954 RepID=A0ABS9C7U0_9FLAO|nr:Abi-alpha family protein [Chryseobacterium sp. PS-8]MCF2219391.1 DUF4393 domain-containing protein [Chryseobacterium sp. PS-8]